MVSPAGGLPVVKLQTGPAVTWLDEFGSISTQSSFLVRLTLQQCLEMVAIKPVHANIGTD